jgi:hypothetical protein
MKVIKLLAQGSESQRGSWVMAYWVALALVSAQPASAEATASVQPPTSTIVAAPQPLTLACTGGGTAYKETLLNDIRPALITDQVDITLFSRDDRIRLPRAMVPVLHGGTGGWSKLKNVNADAKTIRATAPLNFYSNLKVYIDRVTGAISISGETGDYSGQCEVVDANAPAKF